SSPSATASPTCSGSASGSSLAASASRPASRARRRLPRRPPPPRPRPMLQRRTREESARACWGGGLAHLGESVAATSRESGYIQAGREAPCASFFIRTRRGGVDNGVQGDTVEESPQVFTKKRWEVSGIWLHRLQWHH